MIEVIVSVPPPVFWIPSGCDSVALFAATVGRKSAGLSPRAAAPPRSRERHLDRLHVAGTRTRRQNDFAFDRTLSDRDPRQQCAAFCGPRLIMLKSGEDEFSQGI